MRDRTPALVSGVRGLDTRHGRLLVAVGVFDGLHRGHMHLLEALVREARARAARPTVLTFDAHPDEIVRGVAPALLLDPDERLARLAAAGVEVVVVVHFDERVRRTPYDAFVASIAARVELAGFVMTPDAAFGHERQGTPTALAALGRGADRPFDVVVVTPLEIDGAAVRSSDIRGHVAAGRLEAARRLLGRDHAVTGAVDRDGLLSFEVPVALPPDGRYEACTGRPIVVGDDPDEVARAGEHRQVEISGGLVRVRSSAAESAQEVGGSAPNRVRVAFAAGTDEAGDVAAPKVG